MSTPTYTLMVFGNHEARRRWLYAQVDDGRNVSLGQAVVYSGSSTTIARVVSGEQDYQRLMGLELSDVVEHESFRPPAGWWTFIASRIRRGDK